MNKNRMNAKTLPFYLLLLFSLVVTLGGAADTVSADSTWSQECDAAQGVLHNVSTENSESGYVGEGYVAGWNGDGQAVDLIVDVPADGHYTLTFRYSAAAGLASRYLEINGEGFVDEVRFSGSGSWGDWQTVSVNNVPLTEGENTISLIFDSSKGSTNWLNYDSLLVTEQGEDAAYVWGQKASQADQAQHSLKENFWNPDTKLFDTEFPVDETNTQFHYWWQAHGIDTLVDGYERTSDRSYLRRAADLYEGVLERNGGQITNDFYDDMLWMALSMQRLAEHTNEEEHHEAVLTLWEDIQTGWSDEYGGGIAWNKNQLDYKNTPSNAPAVILAVRLYEQYGNEEDLEWALDIYNWQKETLVDPETGIAWDGINRTGDGSIDKGWLFTYNQGVYIGASVELYGLTGNETYLEEAVRTAEASKDYSSNHNQMIYEGGSGDGGLFKGIFVRYVTDLVKVDPSQNELGSWILHNAETAWRMAESGERILFGSSWEGTPVETNELSQQLSGVMLMEHAAELEHIMLQNAHHVLSGQLETFINNGKVNRPAVQKLTNRLSVIERFVGKGQMKQALKQLENFEKHLEQEWNKGNVSDDAYNVFQDTLAGLK